MSYLASVGGVSPLKATDSDLVKRIKAAPSWTEAKKIIRKSGVWSVKDYVSKYGKRPHDPLTGEYTDIEKPPPAEKKTIKESIQSIKEGTQLVKEKKAEFFKNNPDATTKEWLKYKNENMKNW